MAGRTQPEILQALGFFLLHKPVKNSHRLQTELRSEKGEESANQILTGVTQFLLH